MKKKKDLPINKDIKPDISTQERIEFLKLEMQILQGRFDKYDDLVNKSRNWLNAILLAALGYGIANNKIFLQLGPFIVLFFYVSELIWRIEYWYQYVVRYRYIRDVLNSTQDIQTISIYDLTNKYGKRPKFIVNIKSCLNNFEMIFFYSFWIFLFLTIRFYYN